MMLDFYIYTRLNESNTESYTPPKFITAPFPGDTGYELVRKSYRRQIWTWNEYGGKQPNLPKGETARKENSNEANSFGAYNGEVMGMGGSDDFPGEIAGYTGPLKYGELIPTDRFMDPDDKERDRKKKKYILDFDYFPDENDPAKSYTI